MEFAQIASVEPAPASWSFRRAGLRNAWANARHDSVRRPRIPIRGSISASVELWKIHWEDSKSLARLVGVSAQRARRDVDKEDPDVGRSEARPPRSAGRGDRRGRGAQEPQEGREH